MRSYLCAFLYLVLLTGGSATIVHPILLYILFLYILFLVHPIFGASYLWGSVPSYVVPYISVSYFSTSYFWFFLSLRFPILNLRFLMSVYPMFGVSYFCVPIFMSSHLHVTLKMGWHRLPGTLVVEMKECDWGLASSSEELTNWLASYQTPSHSCEIGIRVQNLKWDTLQK